MADDPKDLVVIYEDDDLLAVSWICLVGDFLILFYRGIHHPPIWNEVFFGSLFPSIFFSVNQIQGIQTAFSTCDSSASLRG